MLGFLVPKDLTKLLLKKKIGRYQKDFFFLSQWRVMGSGSKCKMSRSSLLNLLWQKFNRITSSVPIPNFQEEASRRAGSVDSLSQHKSQQVMAAAVILHYFTSPCFSFPPLFEPTEKCL